MAGAFSYQRRLQWSECDPAGIIFFPNYARWVVEGLNDWLFSLGIDPNEPLSREIVRGMPCVECSLKFHKPPVLHEIVTHEISLVRIGRSSLTFAHRFFKGDILFAEAADTRIWVAHSRVDPSDLKSEEIPQRVRDLLSGAATTA
jgi:4-hydroxybenzoyl-CoA thioesterase